LSAELVGIPSSSSLSSLLLLLVLGVEGVSEKTPADLSA